MIMGHRTGVRTCTRVSMAHQQMLVVVLVSMLLASANGAVGNDDEGSDCFVKWVHGYRLASGRPQKILHSVSLEMCKQECASTPGCAAFAYGSTPGGRSSNSSSPSSICELAINSRFRMSSSSSSSSSRYNNHNSMNSGYYGGGRNNPNGRFFNPRDGRSVSGGGAAGANGTGTSTTTSPPPTITIQDLDRNPTYDVYIENPNSNEPCFKRDALYESSYPISNQIPPLHLDDRGPPHHHGNGVPIDCFYRLMSGKRLVKTHTLRAISVNSLQECQEACIHERGFNCRSISYRYMPSSGYSYPVSNCELSTYYMQSGTISSSYSKLDFVEDYDYDYFQRESHCKTTSSTTLGVCAVVVRRGGRVSTTLIKSSHHTITSSQCEHLCATSLFRCRAFSFRHTTRGRDPYVSGSNSRFPSSSPLTPTRDLPPPQDHTCLLYDTDLMRLPSYNIEPDPDFDLFEMGRLMGAECVLYEQFLNRRPGYYSPGPVTSTSSYPPENRDYYGDRGGGGYYNNNNNNGGMMSSRERDRGSDQHPHGTGTNYLINRENNRGGSSGTMHGNNRYNDHHVSTTQQHNNPPPSTLETGLMIGGGNRDRDRGGSSSYDSRYNHHHHHHQYDRPVDREDSAGNRHQVSGARPPVVGDQGAGGNGSSSNGGGATEQHRETPYYDKGKESCLRVFRQDSYLIPEVSRATFPVKTVDECRIECIRSLQVLRFPCMGMAYRHTSHTSLDRNVGGGSCQLTDNAIRDADLIQSRDRYEGAVTFMYDDREPGCARGPYGGGGGYYDDRDRNRDRDRYPGYVDYYNQNRNSYNPSYHHQSNYNSYNNDRYSGSSYYPASNRYYNDRDQYDRRWSTSSSASPPPPNYNPHYWDYHNRYSGNKGGGYYHQGQAASSNYYSEYPNGQGQTTVNGERCMRDCRQNRDAGFYYCQIDEQGAWDFCCRPDHFCGYSKGLSVPWCYVGTGPSQNIWRSCEAKGSRNNPFFSQPHVAYLHDRLPPTVFSLTSTQVANLTKDNAIRLFTNNTIEEIGNPETERFAAKPVESSQETIVRISNGTSSVSGPGGGSTGGGGGGAKHDSSNKETEKKKS